MAATRTRRDLPPFDGGYVRRLRSGDPETERHFALYFAEMLRVKLRSNPGSPLRARQLEEDAAQETFVRGLQSVTRRQRDTGAGPAGSVRQRRVLQRSPGAVSIRAEALPDVRRLHPGPGGRWAQRRGAAPGRRTERGVRRAIDELPARERRLLRALYVEECDKDTICRELGVSRAYLRVLLHRAKLRFRTLYLEGLPGKAGSLDKPSGSFLEVLQ